MTLYECFETVPDHRSASGRRTPLPALLCMVTMSYMSGYTGYRPVSSFMSSNKETFKSMFNLKHSPIKHTQLRTVISGLDFPSITEAFSTWMRTFLNVEQGEWFSGDGKSLGSTVVDVHGAKQEYELMVRLFRQKLGIVTHVSTTKSKASELKAMQSLLKKLELKGIIITLDALLPIAIGSQKKQLTSF